MKSLINKYKIYKKIISFIISFIFIFDGTGFAALDALRKPLDSGDSYERTRRAFAEIYKKQNNRPINQVTIENPRKRFKSAGFGNEWTELTISQIWPEPDILRILYTGDLYWMNVQWQGFTSLFRPQLADILKGIGEDELKKLDEAAKMQGLIFNVVSDPGGAFIKRIGNEILINAARTDLSP